MQGREFQDGCFGVLCILMLVDTMTTKATLPGVS